jgi:hypothetical protein
MASLAVAKVLSAQTYEAFYVVAHEYSEHLLVHLVAISGRGHVISLLIPRLEQSADVPANVLAACQAIRSRAPSDEVRRFFWPYYDDTDRDWEEVKRLREEVLRVRWKPYDVETWDRFVDELRVTMADTLEMLNQNIRSLQSWIADAGLPPDNDSELMAGVAADLTRSMGKLQRLLQQDGFPIDDGHHDD